MIKHEPSKRPEKWHQLSTRTKYRWMIPFVAFEWGWEWVAFLLSNWKFLEVLEYLGSFSVLAAVIFYFSESGDRVKQRHYQAWQVINTAQGKGGSGGRIEALMQLNEDKVPLVGVDVSSAFLQALKLENANLLRADFSAADLRGCDLEAADFTQANLQSTNLRGCNLEGASFRNADLREADLTGSDLAGARLDEADLASADLRSADLRNIQWQKLRGVRMANIADTKNAPAGFVEWALKNVAVQLRNSTE